MEKIQGLLVAPFTPFHKNGEVNYEPIARYAAMLHKNGLKGVFINGSSGEGYMLSDEERMRLAEKWVEVAPKDFKIIPSPNSIEAIVIAKISAEVRLVTQSDDCISRFSRTNRSRVSGLLLYASNKGSMDCKSTLLRSPSSTACI